MMLKNVSFTCKKEQRQIVWFINSTLLLLALFLFCDLKNARKTTTTKRQIFDPVLRMHFSEQDNVTFY